MFQNSLGRGIVSFISVLVTILALKCYLGLLSPIISCFKISPVQLCIVLSESWISRSFKRAVAQLKWTYYGYCCAIVHCLVFCHKDCKTEEEEWLLRTETLATFPQIILRGTVVSLLCLALRGLVCAFPLLFVGRITTSANRAIWHVFKKGVTSKVRKKSWVTASKEVFSFYTLVLHSHIVGASLGPAELP